MLPLKRLWQAEFTRRRAVGGVSAAGPAGSQPEPPIGRWGRGFSWR